MTWLLLFLSVGIVLGLSVMQVLKQKEKRKKSQKDEIWDKQLEDLLQSLKKKKE